MINNVISDGPKDQIRKLEIPGSRLGIAPE
jgi:hypothetical protein